MKKWCSESEKGCYQDIFELKVDEFPFIVNEVQAEVYFIPWLQ